MATRGSAAKRIVLVGHGIPDRDGLLSGLPAGTTIVPVAVDACPIAAISGAVAAHAPVAHLALIAHGRPGAVALGTGLDASVLLDHSRQVRTWRDHLGADATIQLLACEAGAGQTGRQLVDLLASFSGAAIAAADQTLGQAALGGVWQLDVVAGAPEDRLSLDPAAQMAWAGTLSWNVSPNSTADVYTGDANDNNSGSGLGNDDTLTGAGGHDTLTGGADQDSISGEDGDDQLFGESGHDRLFGGNDQDRLEGGDGDDTLDGGSGSDTLYGGNDADSIVGGLQADTLEGGAGSDTLRGGDDHDVLNGGDQSDTLFGDDGGDTLNGGDDHDSISGGIGDDRLIGEGGADTLQGGVDQDSLEGGIGDDRLFGETGNDTLYGGVDQDSLDGGDGSDTLVGDDGGDTLRGGIQADSLVGGNGDDRAEVAPGEIAAGDSFDGGADNDTLFVLGSSFMDLTGLTLTSVERLLAPGTGGNSITITGAQLAGFSSIEGSSNVDTITSADSMDFTGKTLISFERFIASASKAITLPAGYATATTLVGSTGNETLTGGAGADSLVGANGLDVLSGGVGADTLDGGGGTDTITGGAGADVFTGAAELHGDTITDFTSEDTISFISVTLSSVGLGDGVVMAANSAQVEHNGMNTLVHLNDGTGTTADATITLTGNIPLGDFSISGGKLALAAPVSGGAIAGATLALSGATTALSTVTFDAAGVATGTFNGAALTPTGGANTGLTQVTAAALTGTGAVQFTGNASNNTLTGSANADTLNGASGNDSLIGGTGADSLLGGLGVDTVRGGAGADTITILAGDTQPSEEYHGEADADTLLLSAGSHAFHQSTVAGFEFLIGSAGGNAVTLNGSQLSQFTSSIDLGGGTDVLHLEGVAAAIDLTSFPFVSVEHIRLNPTTGITITDTANSAVEIDAANTFNHTIVGSGAGDLMFGGAGGDSLQGGGGADTIDGGNGANKLEGGTGADILFGGTGSDTLVGGGEADTLVGGAGDDTIELGGGGEVVFGGANNDIVSAGSGTVGAVIVGDTLLSDAFNDLLNGTNGADTIFGCGGADAIAGHAGDDSLLGGDGSDTLTGGAGNDALWGGAGNDRFQFLDDITGTDVIVDFTVGPERLAFGFSDFSAVQQTLLGNGLEIRVGLVTVRLIGITAPLTATDMIFFTPT